MSTIYILWLRQLKRHLRSRSRMIGSLGRDRAEASGELVPLGSPQPAPSSTQRELITILPRRITREMQVVTSPPDAAPVVESARPLARPGESPVLRPLPPRIASAGSGVRRVSGPGTGALALLALAGVLTIIAIYLYVTRAPARQRVVADALEPGPVVTPIREGGPDAMGFGPSLDATVERLPDAAVPASRDAAVVVAPRVDPVAQAKLLMDQANDALTEGDAEKALQLANASLRLRRTIRTLLVRAKALQRLDRVEDALASIDEAEAIDAGFAPVYEWRAKILRAARRKDEAREAMEKYLQLKSTGEVAADFERWLAGPR